VLLLGCSVEAQTEIEWKGICRISESKKNILQKTISPYGHTNYLITRLSELEQSNWKKNIKSVLKITENIKKRICPTNKR